MYSLSPITAFGIVITIASPIALATSLPVAATPEQVARPISVRITGKSQRGSGVIVSRNGNRFSVLTNAHVVEQSDTYRVVTADGVSHQIRDRTIIPDLDLALLNFTSDNNYAVAAIDNSPPALGDTIYVAGYPRSGGSLRQPIFKVTSGEVRETSSALPLGYALTYTNIVRAGMSGGAILNAEGKLIGINGLVRADGESDRAVASGIAIASYLQWRGAESSTATAIPPTEPVSSGNPAIAKISLANGGVNALVYNEQTQTIIGGSSTGKIAIWQLATQQPLSSWQGHQSAINATAIAPDGKTLASGGDDGTIHIWDLTQNKLLQTLDGHTGAITDLVFGADNNTLFSSSWDSAIHQWQLDRGKVARTFSGHQGVVNAIALAPNGKTLASGGRDNTIRLWDVATGKLRTTLAGHSLAVLALDISANNKHLVSGSGDGTIFVWNLDTNESVATLRGHTDGVWQVAFANNLQTVVSGSWDKTIKVWNLQTATLQTTLTEHQDYIGALTLSSDGKTFISGDWQGQIFLWRL